MKVTAKRTHVVVKLTKAELSELRYLLGDAIHEKMTKPLTWALKPHKKRAKLLAELTGLVDGASSWDGRDPDAEPGEGRGPNPYDDEDRMTSEAYAVAYREAKKLGLGSTRL